VTAALEVLGPVTDYLPHRPPMLLIDQIVEVTELRVVCRTTIHRGCVFAIDGSVHPSAMIEFVAQACAIFVGVRGARDGDPPRLGLIMSCREVTFAVDSFAVGDELTIAATKVFGQKQLAAFTGTVSRGDVVCATVQLSVVDAALAAARVSGEAGEAGDAGDASNVDAGGGGG
jgi:predicted hotdog family 3-hydroxylacyl-ACP dehydratase